MEDAWASIGEEGRGKLRKYPGICKQDLIRKYPNGETRYAEGIAHFEVGQRRELKHLSTCRKRKKISISRVVASEKEIAQTDIVAAISGL